jgi:hypothetical protein
LVPQLSDRLREVDVYATLVDEDVFHLEVGLFACLCVLELNEREAQRVPNILPGRRAMFLADNLARTDWA